MDVIETGLIKKRSGTRPMLVMLAGACLLSLGVTAGHAQNCNNAAATPSVCAFDATKNTAADTKIKGVLLYDWSAQGGHDRQFTQRSMMRLAQKYGFRLDRSQDANYITAQTLQGIDLVVFNNGNGDPVDKSASLTAIRNFVEVQGKSVLVVHAGASFIPCPSENLSSPDCRWLMRGIRTQFWIHNNDGTRSTIFADSVKAGEIPPRATGTSAVPAKFNHGRANPDTKMIYESLPTNGGAGPLANKPYIWEGLGDEWYNYLNNPRLEGERTLDGATFGPVNILLSLDESSQPNSVSCSDGSNCKNKGTFGDRPVSWVRKVGKGKVAYQNAGHSDVYVRQRVVGGVNVNDSLIEKFNWRLMKYLAGDFEGPVSVTPKSKAPEIQPSLSQGLLRVPLDGQGSHQVDVADLQGRTVFSRSHEGPGQLDIPDLKAGSYVVKVTSAAGERVHKVEIRAH